MGGKEAFCNLNRVGSLGGGLPGEYVAWECMAREYVEGEGPSGEWGLAGREGPAEDDS